MLVLLGQQVFYNAQVGQVDHRIHGARNWEGTNTWVGLDAESTRQRRTKSVTALDAISANSSLELGIQGTAA